MSPEEISKRKIESFDPTSFNIQNLPQVCRNDVFETIEEYKKLEALRLRKTRPAESTTPLSADGAPTNGTNGNSLSSYIPQLSDPVKILCCKAHVFRDSAGQGHFQTNEAWRVTRLFQYANLRYEGPHSPSDVPNPPAPLISDTRIRFKLSDSDVQFYDDTALHSSISQAALQAAAVARNPKTLDFINVYLTAGSLAGAASFASLPSTALGWDSWVVGLGAPAPQSDPNYNVYDWAGGNTLAHELGHVLDLLHTYWSTPANANADCTINSDFLSDVFGTNPSTCPHVCDWPTNAYLQETPGPNAVITNNLMGGNKDNFWISGLQAAMMHRALKEKSVQRYRATGCDDCVSCVAFMARGVNHLSSGSRKVLVYATIDLNEAWGWTAGLNAFVAPVSGIYQFAVSFMGSASGGTSGEVFVLILRNGTSIARARNGAATGQRAAASVSANVQLQAGDVVNTFADSVLGTTRTIPEYNFEGHLICECC